MNTYSTQPYSPIYPNYTYASPTYTTPMTPTYTAPAPSTNGCGFDWVQGEAGARAYSVPPNGKFILMDSETSRFYIKSTDASGIPQPLKIFEYYGINLDEPAGLSAAQQTQTQPQSTQPQKQYNSDLITRGELNKILNERFPKNPHNSNNNSVKENK